MKVIILAAGLGKRLSPLTDKRVKTLLKIGGKSVLVRILENYKEVGFKKFVIVTGTGSGSIEKEVRKLKNGSDIAFQIVFNPKYNTANNCQSLLVGIEGINESIVVTNSDIIFDKRIVDILLGVKGDTLIVDKREDLGPEDMKVIVRNNRIVDINKNLDTSKSFGEYIGIAVISKHSLPLLRESLGEVVRQNPYLYYEDAFRLMFKKVPFGVLLTNSLWWEEVDTFEDLKRVRKFFRGAKKVPSS